MTGRDGDDRRPPRETGLPGTGARAHATPAVRSCARWTDSGADDRDGLRLSPVMHFQPVVDLDRGRVVGFEALARDVRSGQARPPAQLFAQARAAGRLVELDWTCRTAALEDARAGGLGGSGPDLGRRGTAVLVNAEPQAAGSAPPARYLRAEQAAPPGLVRVLEVTERALALRPAPLLDMVDGARRRGWRIALDDVGAQWASLSLLPFLQPDVIKLDLRLVQRRTDVHAAEVVNAVAVQRAATGAVVLVEGIETDEHLELARSMGAQLGQGFLLGRPALLSAGPADPLACAQFPWPRLERPQRTGTPWQQLPPGAPVRRATKPLLVGIARWLERQAMALGEAAVVLATFERAEYFTPRTVRRYATLAGSASIVGVFAQDLPPEPAPRVRAASLSPQDQLCAEWDVVVVGPHFTGALLAHDLGDTGPDGERRFDYLVTYDRDQVLSAAADLLRRLPDLEDQSVEVSSLPVRTPGTPDERTLLRSASRHHGGRDADHDRPRMPAASVDTTLAPLLARALAVASDGLAISDATVDDLPLVYVNPAYERLSGHSAEALLGRNPRILQAPEADPEALRALRTAVTTGREVRTTLLNARPDGTRWWNELHLVPVHDERGRLTHWIGTQQDVSHRVHLEQQAAYLAHHDPLTGLANRRRLVEYLPAEIGRAGRSGTSVALLCLDLDRFKDVNDAHGHPAGDDLLVQVAARLRRHRRVGDLLVRQGGDEFLLVLSGLPHSAERADAAARLVAEKLHDELRQPFTLDAASSPVLLTTSIGISHCPHDAQDAAKLLDHADRALYEIKHRGRDGTQTFGQGHTGRQPVARRPLDG